MEVRIVPSDSRLDQLKIANIDVLILSPSYSFVSSCPARWTLLEASTGTMLAHG